MLIVALAFALAAGASDAKSCKDPTTGHFVKCSTAAAAPAAPAAPASKKTPAASTPMASAAAPSASTSGGAPHCKTGKPCGNSCIAQNKVCHK
jgi:hypothetical protein